MPPTNAAFLPNIFWPRKKNGMIKRLPKIAEIILPISSGLSNNGIKELRMNGYNGG